MAMTAELLETVADGVATLTFNRPERRNALSPDIINGLLEALPRLSADASVGAIVVTGAGRSFCAGGDVKAMSEADAPQPTDVQDATRRLRGRMETARLLHELPTPTIAMLNGAAAGAGLSLALACDLRIAAESARLVTAFANVAFSGDYGGSYFLSKLVGTAKAREMYYLAEPMDAGEALRLGLVNRVVPDDELAAATMALASRIANGPRGALSLMKRNFNAAETATLHEMLDLEARHHALSATTDDHREAVRAFVEKRAPRFGPG